MQVVSLAESLRDSEGRPLVRSARIASSIPLPQEVPDLVVATPAGLMNATVDLGPYAGWEWTKSGIVSRYILCDCRCSVDYRNEHLCPGFGR